MVKIFSMTELVDETGKRENGRSRVKKRKGCVVAIDRRERRNLTD